MAWRTARSLAQLIAQVNGAWPDRSRLSDGTIGDAAHATRDSDHNPWYGPGIVTAADVTHDPGAGADMHRLAASLVASRDRRIKYLIWDRRICSGAGEYAPWVWRLYTGTNPHTKHLHLSVVASALCDDVTPWAMPAPAAADLEDDMPTADEVADAVMAKLYDPRRARGLHVLGARIEHTEQIAGGHANAAAAANAAELARDGALAAAVEHLASTGGGAVDLAAVRQAAEDGAAAALARARLVVAPAG